MTEITANDTTTAEAGGAGTYPRTQAEWVRHVGLSDRSTGDAAYVLRRGADKLGRYGEGDDGDVLALGAALSSQPPAATGALAPVEALSLATTVFRWGLAPGDHQPGDTDAVAALVRDHITGLHRDGGNPPFMALPEGGTGLPEVSYTILRQRAAAQAVTELGGPVKLGIPTWVPLALNDESSQWTLDSDHYDLLATECANKTPGRAWHYATGLGFVVWSLS